MADRPENGEAGDRTPFEREAEGLPLPELIGLILRDLPRPDETATRRDVANLYGAVMTQHDVFMSLYSLVLQARPDLVFSDASTDFQARFKATTRAISDGLIQLAGDDGDDER